SQLTSSDDITITVNPYNVAAGKTAVTASATPYGSPLSILTDGDSSPTAYIGLPAGPQWLRLDLEGTYTLEKLTVWHFSYPAGRTYHDVILQLSRDGQNWTTVYNNDTDNSAAQGAGSDSEYPETDTGKTVTLATPI